jgi:hypothetical protein
MFGTETIRLSVGRSGTNFSDDVLLVKRLINRNIERIGPLIPLAENTWVDNSTIYAIEQFQKQVLNISKPSGLVEPEDTTLRALLDYQPINGRTVVWGQKVSLAFKQKVFKICNNLSINPDHLMACMAFESGGTFSPSKRNAAGSGAVGLIQFMPQTATGLGTDTKKLAVMSAENQLDYVEAYFAKFKKRGLKTLEDLYMAILWPAAVGESSEYVLFEKPSKDYDQNKGLDANRDGKVTKFEAATAVRSALQRGASWRG